MTLAVVKPDHLGDLVMASPAIRGLAAVDAELALFVAPASMGLAGWLFPELDIRPASFRHLARAGEAAGPAPDLLAFDKVAFLRRDGVLTPEWALSHTRDFAMFEDSQEVHQTVLEWGVAHALGARYDIDALFHAGAVRTPTTAVHPPRRVGLCIGSGFHTNAWPLSCWSDLARALAARGCEVRVIGGAAERTGCRLISGSAGLGDAAVLTGGQDYAAFVEEVAGLDLVIASDGGSAHLCSLAAPVLSLFGSSPYRRYAPFGAHTHMLTAALACSPCIQYASRLVNACLTVHCMSAIAPSDVLAALDALPSSERARELRPGLQLLAGVSHWDRGELIAARELETEVWSIA